MGSEQIPAEERQINLLLALRHSERGMTKTEILRLVNGYDAAGGATVNRMFERDKDALRALGIPICATPVGSAKTGTEMRYSIDEEDYQLPEITFTAWEARALQTAAQAWHNRSLTVPARRALTKLRAVTALQEGHPASDQEQPPRGILPPIVLDLGEQELPESLIQAITHRQRVSFEYMTTSAGKIAQRIVEPHRVKFADRGWYLYGYDLTAAGERSFRLDRILGDIELGEELEAYEIPTDSTRRRNLALVAVTPGRARALRARGSLITEPDRADKQREIFHIEYRDLLSFAGELAAYGDAVEALEPAELRSAVINHLQGAASLTEPEVIGNGAE